MTAVNISGTFRKDEKPLNGLQAIAKELLDRDRTTERYVVVAIVRPFKSNWVADDGIETPIVRFDHIEVLDGQAADTAREMLNEAYRARTGRGEDPPSTLFDGNASGDGDTATEDGPVSQREPDMWLDSDLPATTPKRGRAKS